MAKKKRKTSFRGKVKADNQNHQGSGSKYNILKLPEGIELYKPQAGNRDEFDILPYIVTDKNHPDKSEVVIDGEKVTFAGKGDIWYKRPYKVHKDIGADNQTVVCLESFGKPCPVCEYRKAQLDNGVEWEEVKVFKAKDRVLYIINPVKIKKAKEAFYILDMSFHLFQKQLNAETNEDEDYEDFPALESGYTLKVRWEEGSLSKKGREYCEAGRIDFIQREEDYEESILEEVPNLDELLIEMSYDKLKGLFFEENIDEKEEEEKPPKKKTKKKEESKELDWGALQEMELDDLIDACEAFDLDPSEIVDEDKDEEAQEKQLRKALAEELEIEIPKEKKAKKSKKETEETPKKQKRNKGKKEKKTDKDPICPEEGMTFGVSTDESEACDDCGFLQACIKKNEEA